MSLWFNLVSVRGAELFGVLPRISRVGYGNFSIQNTLKCSFLRYISVMLHFVGPFSDNMITYKLLFLININALLIARPLEDLRVPTVRWPAGGVAFD